MSHYSAIAIVLVSAVALAQPATAADDSQVKKATRQVESGAKQIGQGEIGDGVKETAKGIGNTVTEGAKFTGDKLKDAGRAAEPQAKSAWQNTVDGAKSFGRSVRNFFTSLF